MKLHEYSNYDEYIKIQKSHVTNNQRIIKQKRYDADSGEKLGWAKEDHLIDIYNKFLILKPNNKAQIICHGVRNGYESKFFMDKFGLNNVYSTDLFDVFKFDKTNFRMQDFDTIDDEWENKFDFLYSNVIDHSRHPIHTLSVWANQINNNGILCVVFSCGIQVTDCDCFALDMTNYKIEINNIIKNLPLKLLSISKMDRGLKNRDKSGTINVFFKKCNNNNF